jgi:hypothetical protein
LTAGFPGEIGTYREGEGNGQARPKDWPGVSRSSAQSLCDFSNCLVDRNVLPKPNDPPSPGPERPVNDLVSVYVALKLRMPIAGWVGGDTCVLRATMPEAAIYEYR